MAEIASTTFSQVDASNTGPLPGLTGATNPNQIDNSIQAMMGAVKREHDWRNYAVTSGGSSNAYTLTYAVAPAAYYTPMRFTFKTSFAVTGAATVNVNTLGAKTIKKLVSGTKTDLASGDIASGDYIDLVYDGTDMVWVNKGVASAPSGALTSSGYTMSTARLIGRTTASTGAPEEISVGSGLSMSGTTLIGGREVLTADRTLYVRTDGNDANDGSADDAAHAFLTVQAAINAAYKIDSNGFDLIVKMADGTYSTSGAVRNASFPKAFVGGKIILRGNTTTPANVNLVSANEHAIFVGSGAIVHIEGIKIASTSGVLLLLYGIGAEVTFDKIDFGATSNHHISVVGPGRVSPSGNYTISGGATNHWAASDGAHLNFAGRTVTISATVSITTFVWSERNTSVLVSGMTFTNKANVTGTRYWVAKNGIIDTDSGGASYLPGTVAGSTSTGGQYL